MIRPGIKVTYPLLGTLQLLLCSIRCTPLSPNRYRNNNMKFLLTLVAILVGTTYSMHTYHRPQRPYTQSLRQSRSQPNNVGVFKSLGDFFHKMHVAATKRCAYLLDESCGNGGIPGAGSDSDWLNQGFNPGKRGLNLFDEGTVNGGIPGIGADSDFLNTGFNPGKRCANVMDEACSNGGIPGSGSDRDWLDSGDNPGKRCVNTMDESCSNGGIPGSGSDSDWLNGGFNPGRRQIAEGEGIPGAADDNDWLHGGDTPGRR